MIDSRWMTEEEYEAIKGTLRGSSPVTVSTCKTTGVSYYALIVGRFRDLPDDILRAKRMELLAELPAGAALSGETKQPLWVQVEFYANLIEFETNPPCGCNAEGGHDG
jgi:hypothetical protein